MIWHLRLDGYNDYTCEQLSYLPWDATDARIARAVENDLGVRNLTIEILRPDYQKTKDRIEQLKEWRRHGPQEAGAHAGEDPADATGGGERSELR
jgi:hypothetical protein